MKQFSYVEIDSNTLDNDNLIVYLNLDKEHMNVLTSEDFVPFEENDQNKRRTIPDITKRYYQRKFSEGKEPVPFLFIPHILYK